MQLKGRVQRLWLYERVAVLIPTDPRAELESAPESEAFLRELPSKLVFEVSVYVESRGD